MLKQPIAQAEESPTSTLEFDLETIMHRLYHSTICKARINKELREHALVERRQEEDEKRLCNVVGQKLKIGMTVDTVAHMLDASPLLSDAGKKVFREWVDVAYLQAAADEERPLKMRRRGETEETDCVGCKNA